jgi:hypothetical protein
VSSLAGAGHYNFGNDAHRYSSFIFWVMGQPAKSRELRAAVGLSRLWQCQDRYAEASTLLIEVYGWFTEGFDTAD